MRLKDLTKFEIPELIINSWSRRQGDYLLPLQEKAIRAGLLKGNEENPCSNLLISAPTSAGKSFCGEMAAIAALLQRKKAVMLLPLKSIAEEKYRYFRDCYRSIGIRAVIITGDHPENDHDFESGKFDLALAIYEKFNRLLTVNLDILQQVGLVVVDELQMIGDPERGPELEMALTKMICSGHHPRIVALSAVLDDETELADWLNCRVIRELNRPVDLLQGIASGGYFHFRSFNSGLEGREKFDLPDDREDLAESLIQFLKQDSSRKLIFLKSRRDTLHAAFKLAAAVNWEEARTTLNELDGEEPSFLVRSLRQTLSRGVAFHNADLTPAQRQAVEQGYMNGEVRVIFSTTTLAMGVNLPAEMVLLETMKYSPGNCGGRAVLVPITPPEFQNITGRAGRFGLGETGKPGRAVILAGSDFEHEVLWSNYIDTRKDTRVASSLERYSSEDILLELLASGLISEKDDLERVLSRTLLSRQKGKVDAARLNRCLAELASLGLISEDLRPGAVGRAVARCGLTVATYRRYKAFLEKSHPETIVGWLSLALFGAEFDISRCGLMPSEYRSRLYEKIRHQQFAEYSGEITPFVAAAVGQEPLDFRSCAILKAVFLLSDWSGEVSVEQLEQRYQLHHGQIINLAETAAWLIASLGRIIAAGDAGARLPQTLDEYAFMVQFGISPEMRRMHRIAGAALSRGDYRLLREKGIKSLADLQAIPREELANIIKPESKLNRLFQEIESLTMEDTMNRISTVGTGMKFQSATLGLGPGFHPSAVELDGRYEGERYLVKIDNFPIRLTGKSFKYLVKLAHSRLVNGEGWMYKDDIEAGFNQARYLYRLKLEINRDGGCPWGIFENNRLGYYRLDIEPARIRLNLENLKNHPDYEIRCIADQLAPRLVS